ncbi:MAG: alpha-2-macroglobulin, partial [Burkholderiaceae bacterium]|nr:alpha-2-macroglobulin [Burkholderiaceae bacterium]
MHSAPAGNERTSVKVRHLFFAWALATAAVPSPAFQVSQLSPRGEVAQVRQVVVRFDEAAVRLGDAAAPAPFTLQCSDPQAAAGSGRWQNERQWVFQFNNDLPPGVRCSLQARAGLASLSGQPLGATGHFAFSTGGPFVRRVHPGTWQRIEEDQHFVLELNGPATPASVQASVWCGVDGLGERVPVRLIDGANRQAILAALHLDKLAARDPLRFVTLACNRRLTPDTRLQLVYGKGVATPSGIVNTLEKRFAFQVREAFNVAFSCERESAQAACLPIRPMRLSFSSPVVRKLAEGIRLRSAAASYAPRFDDEPADASALVNGVSFPGVLPESTTFTVALPQGFQDASDRSPANATSYPLPVATGVMPPLAKFAAAPFGIIERFAEPDASAQSPALLPVTLRRVEPALPVASLTPGGQQSGKVADLTLQSDADIVRWYRKVQRFNGFSVPRSVARADIKGPLPKALASPPSPRERGEAAEPRDDRVQTRMVSLLAGQPGVQSLELPRTAGTDPRPFEVVGIPLSPGFHVVEIASPLLGEALLDPRQGSPRTMYVRTAALVTNLGVHFKLGRENARAWVTTLDRGRPVAGARVQVSDCNGKLLASAVTDENGLAPFTGLSPTPPACTRAHPQDDDDQPNGYFISARATVQVPRGSARVADMAFTWSHWQRGIEPWRFNLPTSQEALPDQRAHTIFDRSLLRAGETVSMKHLLRSESTSGLTVPAATATWPDTMVVTHQGSGQQYTQPLNWRRTATGGLSAESRFQLPQAARLGVYEVELRRGGERGRSLPGGEFRVEAFRLPVFEGRIGPAGNKPLVDVKAVPAEVQIAWVSGGPAAGLPVRVSALVRKRFLDFPDYEDFNFQPPRKQQESGTEGDEDAPATDTRVIADRLPLTLDGNGLGKLTIEAIPPERQPRELLLEASYADPSGEVQTLRSTTALWPSAVVPGIRTEGWTSVGRQLRLQALALDLTGKPLAGAALQVSAVARTVTTSRKRLVGGFYAYDSQTVTKDLGTVCSGTSDARGLLACEAALAVPGEVELVVTATDAQGHTSQAARSVWVTRQGELWFGGDNHDRMDVLPEKKSYLAGETAKFQVRMPFRHATALVAVEREGVMETHVMQLDGQDPTVSLKVGANWGPNVFVSVLALRGRLHEVPWYSFFTWGFKAPREWWTAFWVDGKEYVAPTALVDLSKPAFRLGAAEIRVDTRAHRLDVSVKTDQPTYPVRGTAKVTVSARLPGGGPAAGAEVALAVVDEALLELMPNASWNLLEAMLQRRAWGVETSTAQMEIVGRRHYGRKAVPAGGGGGKSPTRELFDTLLLWQPAIVLDAKGQAVIEVSLNDALTRFRVVAVADAAADLFGTGQASITTAQDLQLISGLPPLVRAGDTYSARFTLRNTTTRAMKVTVTPRATLLEAATATATASAASAPGGTPASSSLAPRTLELAPGQARTLAWDVEAPAALAFTRQQAMLWEIEAKDSISGARDALKARQRVIPAVPLTVQQATLMQLDGPLTLAVAPPPDALADNGRVRGGLQLAFQPSLAGGLAGVRDWFAAYPFSCLEQQASKAIGLGDSPAWRALLVQLPTYLDADGLASYFPPQAGAAAQGSDVLSAYLLAAAHEAARLDPAFALPDKLRASLTGGLVDFVEGRLQRDSRAPRRDLDVRKLAAIEALSRYGLAQPRMLDSLTLAPNQWPSSAVIDWLSIMRRMSTLPQRDQRLAEAGQVLRARLNWAGTRLTFSAERDDTNWWLMTNGDVNTARLMLAVMEDPAWKDDMGRLASGFIARQQRGAWLTTTANLWGTLALQQYARRFEATPVDGLTRATLGAATQTLDWKPLTRPQSGNPTLGQQAPAAMLAGAAPAGLPGNPLLLPWAAGGNEQLTVSHQGAGKPWMTLQSLAAVPLTMPFNAGYQISRSVAPVEQAVPGKLSAGDVLRVTLTVNASADMGWVVVSDPLPGGASILGGGLGRDSQIAT